MTQPNGRILQVEEILLLAERYAGARQMATSTLSFRAKQSSTWLARCASGRVTIRSAIGFVQWLSDHWPQGLEWPARIERPQPTPSSPAGAFRIPEARAGSRATSPGGLNPDSRGTDTEQPPDIPADTLREAMRLGPAGTIASPGALCRALGFNRSVYYAVVRRYRDEVGAGRWPRVGSECDRMLVALGAAGDTRFASRRTREIA